MKKIPVILLSLLLVSLLILGGLFFFTYSRKESDAKAENKTLQSNIASLQEQLQQKEDFISGQEEYINELTTQLADCQTTTDSEEEEDEDDEEMVEPKGGQDSEQENEDKKQEVKEGTVWERN